MKMLFTILLLLVPATMLAQEVVKPAHQVGEWCEYQNTHGKQFRQTVVAVLPDGGFTLQSEESTRAYNGEHRLVRRNDIEYKPERAGAKFPIRAGDVGGGGKFTYPHSRIPGDVRAETVITSSAKEQVRVPAGVFASVRVDMRTVYVLGNGFRGQLDESIWYALDQGVKRHLKYLSVDHGVTSGSNRTEDVLIGCGSQGAVSVSAGERSK